jgi:hypothetical protein
MNENCLCEAPARPDAVTSVSDGLLLADDCADEPLPFNLREPIAQQTRQLDAARKRVDGIASRMLVPFPSATADPSDCVGWPAPKNPPPRFHVSFPKTPTLVLEGALDTNTPPLPAQSVARAFPNGHYVEVPYVGHVTALADHTGCAAKIASTFLGTGATDTRCLTHLGVPPQVDSFPVTFAQEKPIALIGAHDTTGLSSDDLRTVGVARDAIADVLWDWHAAGNFTDVGLRGGDFFVGAAAPGDDITLHLNDIRWTKDTTATGDLTITRGTRPIMTGNIAVSTPTGSAQLDILAFNLVGTSTNENITGTLDGHAIHVNVDAKLGLF